MRIFSDGQNRTRVFGPRNAGQEVVHQVCRNQKPKKNEVQQKRPFMGGHYLATILANHMVSGE